MRHTGIDIVGDVPWGTHFCHFYEDQSDLGEILVPYFKAGLENNEMCICVTSDPLGKDDVWSALAARIPDLAAFRARGQIEIVDYRQWYAGDGAFEADRVLRAWIEKVRWAQNRGFDGLRLSGNTFWLEEANWGDFHRLRSAGGFRHRRIPLSWRFAPTRWRSAVRRR